MKLALKTKATRPDKFFAVLCLLVMAVLLFTYSGQKKAGPNLADLRQQVESSTKELRQLQSSGDVGSSTKLLNELQSTALSFPSFSQAQDAAGSLWTWAQESGMSLDQMGYTMSSRQLGDWAYPAHSFPLSGKGTPDKVADFVRRLEAAPLRTTGVSQLQITPSQDGTWQFSLVFTVWSQATKVEKKDAGK